MIKNKARMLMITPNWIKPTKLLAKNKQMVKTLEFGRLRDILIQIINKKFNKNRHKFRTTTKARYLSCHWKIKR